MGANAGVAKRARTRVRTTTVFALALFVGGAACMLPALAAQPSAPETDIREYALFAFDTFQFKGSDQPGRGIISGGHLGANGIDSGDKFDSNVVLQLCVNHASVMDADTQVVADSIRINNQNGNCKVWHIFANGEAGGTDIVAQPGGSGPTLYSAPLAMTNIPATPTFDCANAADLSIAKDAVATVLPGTYGNLTFGDGSQVTLVAGGTYTVCGEFKIGKDSHVDTQTGVRFNVAGDFQKGNSSWFGADCGLEIYVGGQHAELGKTATFYGRIYAPNADLGLGNNTDLFGRFWAYRIHSDDGVNVLPCAPTATTTTTVPATTTTTTVPATTTTTTVPATTTTTTVPATTTTTTVPETTTTTTVPTTTTVVIEATTTTTVASTDVTVPRSTVAGAAAELPRTGADTHARVVMGAVLLVSGAGMLAAGRRRRIVVR